MKCTPIPPRSILGIAEIVLVCLWAGFIRKSRCEKNWLIGQTFFLNSNCGWALLGTMNLALHVLSMAPEQKQKRPEHQDAYKKGVSEIFRVAEPAGPLLV